MNNLLIFIFAQKSFGFLQKPCDILFELFKESMKRKTTDVFLIALGATLLFVPFLGGVHLFDWDEINFAESAREMLQTHDFLTVQINYKPFWEKPPLFIWMQVLSMKAFGVNEFAARFPNAVAGVVTLLVLYLTGDRLFGRRFGLLWVLVYAGSILPQFYFHSGIIDPWFNLFIFLGIYFMVLYLEGNNRKETRNIFLSAAFIGLAIMTKGPVGLLILLLTLTVWLILNGSWKKIFNIRFLLIYGITLSLVGGFWFILQIADGHAYLIMDFINYQIRLFSHKDSGHGGFLLYHFVVLYIGVFPASVFMLPALRKFRDKTGSQKNFRSWMMISFWVVLILFTIVKTKIVHYSTFCYFPITFFATYYIIRMIKGDMKFPYWLKVVLTVTAALEGLLYVGLQLFIHYKDQIIARGWIPDPFAVGNLQANVYWSGYEFLIGVFLFAGIFGSLLFFRKNIQRMIIGVFLTSLISTSLAVFIITPKVEAYSQKAAIDFYIRNAGDDVYMDVDGFKSYAQYFYFRKKPAKAQRWITKRMRLVGDVSKPVYVVVKITKKESFLKRYPAFHLLYEKNGFVFFEKNPRIKTKQD